MAHAACPESVSHPGDRLTSRLFVGLGRLVARLAVAWESSDESEIRRMLARSGGRITDSMERELMDRALRQGWAERN